ncbi:helix-turn-helix domain-containing protein [Jeongeupia naejangsanensis]|uniref:Helix-turn-helix transcriptional regulator n=1 Tax=Jeongeupia naejangsanensis TaxID=613195 RepID=A0ABS2BL29_9NEIS|nr:helix-turn-helix domain-containing protein [Jeongeupia naejangsanensis]MBM3116324.1 helix-turn-helix transcriptional regulator [Jeongeupia naejangsanensis]
MCFLPIFQHHGYADFEPAQAFDIVQGGYFEHRLLAAQPSAMRHQRLTLDGVRLEAGFYDFPVIVRGEMPQDSFGFGLISEGYGDTRCNILELNDSEIQIYPPGNDMIYQAGRESRWIHLAVPESRLQQTALARTGRTLQLPRHDSTSLLIPPARRYELIRLADDALRLGHSLLSTGIESEFAKLIAQALIDGYVDVLSDAVEKRSTSRDKAAQRHLKIILKSEQMLESVRTAGVDLDVLARSGGYTRRALELLFNQSVGMTPGRWFMNIRLNGALRDLMMPGADYGVTEVAIKWGFTHLSRFSQHYFQAFGELPRQTLKRARGQALS